MAAIKSQQSEIDSLKDTEQQLLSDLEDLKGEKSELSDQISTHESELEALQLEIEELERESIFNS